MTDAEMVAWSAALISESSDKFRDMLSFADPTDAAGVHAASWIYGLGVPTKQGQLRILRSVSQIRRSCGGRLGQAAGLRNVSCDSCNDCRFPAPGTVFATEDVSTLTDVGPYPFDKGWGVWCSPFLGFSSAHWLVVVAVFCEPNLIDPCTG